ncbi:MAG: type II toxin-antitoxin system death-on-curing family toxin [Ferruginibacter sp.]
MSKIVMPITLDEFSLIFKYAQDIHSKNKEPIPELNHDNLPKIETAINQAFHTFDGIELYKGFVCKAAILFYMIIDNHVLNNGNKRMACITLSFFCLKNDYILAIPEKQLRSLAKEVASIHDKDVMLKKIKLTIRKNLLKHKKNGFR